MYWNPLQDLFGNPRKQMEKKTYPILIPVAVIAAAVNTVIS